VDLDLLADPTSEVGLSDSEDASMVGNDDVDKKEEAQEPVNPMGIGKKRTRSGGAKLFVTAESESGSDSDVIVVEDYGHDNHDRTKRPLRKRRRGMTQPLYSYITTFLTYCLKLPPQRVTRSSGEHVSTSH